jgi:hypothetical protein
MPRFAFRFVLAEHWNDLIVIHFHVEFAPPLLTSQLLSVVPKTVRPLSEQLPNESRKLWEGVTSNLLKKEYGEANRDQAAD